MDKETESRLQWIMWDIANTWKATEDELKLLFWSNGTPWPPVAPQKQETALD
jgi:hypothetical protein